MSAIVVETPEAAAARFLRSLLKPSHIVVALSGGGDSVGLLVALAEAIRLQKHPHRLSAATVDHGLRPESAGEVRDVSEFCVRLDIAHQGRRWDGEKPSAGLMAAAREARYNLLADMAAVAGADVIVTGHTFDDQQETLVMRAARQASDVHQPQRGIADAVLFDRRIWIARPFLGCRRHDIREFLVRHAVSWIDDPSNENMKYERVRVRAALRAADETRYIADSTTLSDVSSQAARWLDIHVRIHGGLVCEIDREGLAAGHDVVAYGLTYLAAVIGGQAFGMGSETLVRILEFLRNHAMGRQTASGVVFDLRRDNLYLIRENRNIAALQLSSGEGSVWDGRFDVFNGSSGPVRIVAGGLPSTFTFSPRLPKGVVKLASATAPTVQQEEPKLKSGESLQFHPRFAPFDRFLTRFDYIFAERLAMAFERMPYLSPPL